MSGLSVEQRQRLTDYHLGLLDENEALDAQNLLAESAQARDFIERLDKVLKPLESLPEPEAPPSLVATTLARVRSVALLQSQQDARGVKVSEAGTASRARPRLLRFPELITIAASIALLVGLFIPALRQWQQSALRQGCAFQQASIGSAMRSYATDHNASLPYMAEKIGKSWMPFASSTGKRTDTSNLFLLVKLGYAKPAVFVCPALKHDPRALEYPLDGLSDFPSESLISYSYQNMFGSYRPRLDSPEDFAILADRNPLLMLGSRPKMATWFLTNISPNHGSDRGHNVLRLNWSVDWETTAQAGYKKDNIWRPANLPDDAKANLRGREVPANSEDSFLGP